LDSSNPEPPPLLVGVAREAFPRVGRNNNNQGFFSIHNEEQATRFVVLVFLNVASSRLAPKNTRILHSFFLFICVCEKSHPIVLRLQVLWIYRIHWSLCPILTLVEQSMCHGHYYSVVLLLVVAVSLFFFLKTSPPPTNKKASCSFNQRPILNNDNNNSFPKRKACCRFCVLLIKC